MMPPSVSRRAVRYWIVVLIAFAIGLGGTAWFAQKQPPLYRANATLVLAPVTGLGDVRQITDALNTLDRRSVVASLAMVPSSRTVREQARAQLQLTSAQLSPYHVSTAVVPDTNVIEVSVEGPDPRIDAAYAYALSAQSIASTRQYYDIYVLKALDWPSIPTEAVGPGLVRKLIVGGILGLLVGIGAALLLAYASIHGAGSRLGRIRLGRRRPPKVIKGVHLPDLSEEFEEDVAAAAE